MKHKVTKKDFSEEELTAFISRLEKLRSNIRDHIKKYENGDFGLCGGVRYFHLCHFFQREATAKEFKFGFPQIEQLLSKCNANVFEASLIGEKLGMKPTQVSYDPQRGNKTRIVFLSKLLKQLKRTQHA